jgi:hypothetical protein
MTQYDAGGRSGTGSSWKQSPVSNEQGDRSHAAVQWMSAHFIVLLLEEEESKTLDTRIVCSIFS